MFKQINLVLNQLDNTSSILWIHETLVNQTSVHQHGIGDCIIREYQCNTESLPIKHYFELGYCMNFRLYAISET